MKAEEIKAEACEHIRDGSKVWIFVRNGTGITRCNVGFDALELLGMAALATHEIYQLMGGDKSLSPTPSERKYADIDKDKEAPK